MPCDQENWPSNKHLSPMRKFLFLFLLLALGAHAEPRRYAVRVKDKTGFVDESGKMVIPAQFRWVYGFREGVAPVQLNGKFGYIDPTGKFVIPPRYEHAYEFSEGLAVVHLGKGMGAIDHRGKLVIPNIYADLGSCHSGRLSFRPRDGSQYPPYGYLDKTGKVVIPATLKVGGNFCDGLALVADDKKELFIDPSGRTVIDIQKARLHTSESFFSEGLSPILHGEKNLTGFMDKGGHVRIPGIFQRTFGFRHGLAAVQLKEKWGFIDPNGKMVIPAIYEFATWFGESGLAPVALKPHSHIYIDRHGKQAVPGNFYSAGEFTNGRALVMDANQWMSLIDTKGKVYWKGKLELPPAKP